MILDVPLASIVLLGASGLVAALAAGPMGKLVKAGIGEDDVLLQDHAVAVTSKGRWTVGLIVGAIAALYLALAPAAADAWTLSFFLMLMTAIALVDLETTFIPDVLSVPLLLGGIAFSPFSEGPSDGAAGALLAWGLMAASFLAVSLRRREFVYSGGDAILAAAGGSIVGLAGVPPFLLVCGVTTLILFAMPAMAERRMPWGPVMCISIAATAAGGLGFFFKPLA